MCFLVSILDNLGFEYLNEWSNTENDDHDFSKGIHISVFKCARQLNHLVNCLNDCKMIGEKNDPVWLFKYSFVLYGNYRHKCPGKKLW